MDTGHYFSEYNTSFHMLHSSSSPSSLPLSWHICLHLGYPRAVTASGRLNLWPHTPPIAGNCESGPLCGHKKCAPMQATEKGLEKGTWRLKRKAGANPARGHGGAPPQNASRRPSTKALHLTLRWEEKDSNSMHKDVHCNITQYNHS